MSRLRSTSACARRRRCAAAKQAQQAAPGLNGGMSWRSTALQISCAFEPIEALQYSGRWDEAGDRPPPCICAASSCRAPKRSVIASARAWGVVRDQPANAARAATTAATTCSGVAEGSSRSRSPVRGSKSTSANSRFKAIIRSVARNSAISDSFGRFPGRSASQLAGARRGRHLCARAQGGGAKASRARGPRLLGGLPPRSDYALASRPSKGASP